MIKQILSIRNRYRQLEVTEILGLCRLLSLIITSVFFIVSEQPFRLSLKVIIISSICVSGILLNKLYSWNINKVSMVLLLLFGETLFNSMILIPTGGLGSPYIWYSLNTILVASFVLKGKLFCWINMIIYFFCTTWVFYSLLPNNSSFWDIIMNESNICLCLIIVTCTLQILATYFKKMRESNLKLEDINSKILEANKKIKDSMNYIIELYQAVHLLTSRQDQSSLIKYLIEYTMKITRASSVFYVQYSNKRDGFSIIPDEAQDGCIKSWLTEHMSSLASLRDPTCFNINDSYYVLSPVCCQYKMHGLLGIGLTKEEADNIDIQEQAKFLSGLGTIALEKSELEKVNKDLLINEEQNRIANEIHDGVLQNLFSISCGLHNLKARIGRLSDRSVKDELQLVQDSVKSAMSDLRSTIYGYSWKKRGVNNFVLDINNYIDSIKSSHGIEASFTLNGNHEMLSVDHKKAFYRIITEGIGNAIRHGKAKRLNITIDIREKDIFLLLEDDGTGFNLKLLDKIDKMGMGIKNIYSLTGLLHGTIQVDSRVGSGTTIKITVPLLNNNYKESAV